jgi:hypothetical protein
VQTAPQLVARRPSRPSPPEEKGGEGATTAQTVQLRTKVFITTRKAAGDSRTPKTQALGYPLNTLSNCVPLGLPQPVQASQPGPAEYCSEAEEKAPLLPVTIS